MIEFVSRLPAGYQEVKYLESNGTQHLVVDVIPNQDTRIDIIAMPFSVANTSAGAGFMPYGAATQYNSNAFECYSCPAGALEFNYGEQYQTGLGSISANTKLYISHNKNNITVTNESGQSIASHSFTYRSFTCPRKLALFATNRSSVLRGAGLRIYSCQIYQNGTLVLDLVPCYRIADGVAGMFNLVNDAFYSNAGTGTFAVGADVDALTTITITEGGIIPMQYALRRRMMVSGGGLFPSVGTPLSDWTWEEIVALSNSGTDPRNYFAVGDEKDLILTTGEVVPTVIGDFYHNTITGTSTKAPIAFTFKNCLNTTYTMNISDTNSGGWNNSAMRKTSMANILNTFPAELIADGAIKYVNVLASAGNQSTSLVTSSDRLRLHSIAELGLSYSYAASGEGTKYAYYTSGNRVKTVGGAASIYWTRSPSTGYSDGFCCVSASGAADTYYATLSCGVACGFDI